MKKLTRSEFLQLSIMLFGPFSPLLWQISD